MKILLINDYGTPTGGAEIQMALIRDELRRRGHDARLFASTALAGKRRSLADYRCFGTTSVLRVPLRTVNPSAYWRLRQVLAGFQPDVVHVRIFETQLSPLIMSLLRDVPSLYHVVWYRPICPLGTKMLPDGTACREPAGRICYQSRCLSLPAWVAAMLQLKLWRRWRNAFDAVICNSEALRERLAAEGIEPLRVVYNGVASRPPRPPLSPPPTVAFAGRLVAEKGVDVLLRAFAAVVDRVPEARLLLAGDGPAREPNRRLIAELELLSSVELLGHLPRQEMEARFAAAWVQAVPSRWEEPFANVGLEAMMRGTAVVASRVGGMSEMVEEGKTGLLVPPGDEVALAAALLRLLCEPGLAERMGSDGRRVALERFSQQASVDALVEIYQTLAQSSDRNSAGRRAR